MGDSHMREKRTLKFSAMRQNTVSDRGGAILPSANRRAAQQVIRKNSLPSALLHVAADFSSNSRINVGCTILFFSTLSPLICFLWPLKVALTVLTAASC